MEGKILLGKYALGRLLGKGNFGSVYEAKSQKTEEIVAIKVINKERVKKVSMEKQIEREISTMSLLKHPNIVELREVMASKRNIYLVMEYIGGGDLYTKISQQGKLDETLARKFFHQLIRAVDYCHSRGVCHRDLKVENILVDSDGETLKLADFGLASLGGDENRNADGLLSTPCGAFAYMAPEIIRADRYDGKKSDIWSCGVILYVLLAGYLPFQDDNRMRMLWKIMGVKYVFPPWFSQEIMQLIGSIFNLNPNKRISMEKIMDSSWFRRYEYEHDHSPFGEIQGFPSFTGVSFNAFDFILTMASGLDLSGLFEAHKAKPGPTFATKCSFPEVMTAVEKMAKGHKFVFKDEELRRIVLIGEEVGRKGRLVVGVRFYVVGPGVNMVGFSKWSGDSVEYRELMEGVVRQAMEGVVWKWQGVWVHSNVMNETLPRVFYCDM